MEKLKLHENNNFLALHAVAEVPGGTNNAEFGQFAKGKMKR